VGTRHLEVICSALLSSTLDFRRANSGLFKELLGGILWARALEGRGVQE